MNIGSLPITGTAALAPMAGAADRAFRVLCREYGAAFSVSEMISAKALSMGDKKSAELMQLDEKERPAAIQLFGDDPETMKRAAALAMKESPAWLDINMGCPAPKIAGNHCGSALLKDPDLCRRLVEAAKEGAGVPVTVKIRTGYDKTSVNAVTVAKACEAGGADAITVHGRTRDQMYSPPVDRATIRAVKQAVSIPVIANGDIASAKDAAKMYEDTGCDLVMVGRAALGAPWIFAQINAYLNNETLLPDPPIAKRMEILLRQVEYAAALKGERLAVLQSRKHASWYMRGVRGAAVFRGEAGAVTSLSDLRSLCCRVIKENE